jgi:uncharacterized membrane protein HdeD (DUF308 family)
MFHRSGGLWEHSGMETTAPPKILPHLWKSTLVSGVLALVLGALVLAWPKISILTAAIVFGAYLLITGISQVFFAFGLHVSAGGRVLLFISGAASLVLAVLCFRSLYDSILLLAIWIGVGFIFRGVATAISAISDHTLPGRIWHIILGGISLLAGLVMLGSPIETLEILTLIVGIWLIVIGAFEVVSSFGIRSASNRVGTALAAEPQSAA